ncbi:MAG: right-handed parallel beta-helix repeat-containing protein, partial [Candidatus Marinimicrobia bacterium]|nr:right-handed parallel beta-helix repeat-containing protein [Candidatus Neomarinimicrobiota bacterium]
MNQDPQQQDVYYSLRAPLLINEGDGIYQVFHRWVAMKANGDTLSPTGIFENEQSRQTRVVFTDSVATVEAEYFIVTLIGEGVNLSESSGNLILFAPEYIVINEIDVELFDSWTISPQGGATITGSGNNVSLEVYEDITITANYQPKVPVNFQMPAGISITIEDPWYYDPDSQGVTVENITLFTCTYPVFLNQNTYELHLDIDRYISSTDNNLYIFDEWIYDSSEVNVLNPYSPSTGVEFFQEGAMITAEYIPGEPSDFFNVHFTLIDSSSTGYGMASSTTRPLVRTENDEWLLAYCQWYGEPTPNNPKSGQIGAAYSENGEDWYVYTYLNTGFNWPPSDRQGRYPSALGNEDYPFVFWNEETGDGGRPYYAYDEFGWDGGSFSPPYEVDPLWNSSKDLWVGSPSYSYDIDNDSHYFNVAYADLNRTNIYLFQSEAYSDGWIAFGYEIEIIELGNTDLFEGGWTTPVLDINREGFGYVAVSNCFSGSSIQTIIFRKTENHGQTWQGDQAGYDYYFIPDNVFNHIIDNIYSNDYDELSCNHALDLRVDSDGNPHFVVGVNTLQNGYMCSEGGFYHFTIDKDYIDNPGGINTPTGWNYSLVVNLDYNEYVQNITSFSFDNHPWIIDNQSDDSLRMPPPDAFWRCPFPSLAISSEGDNVMYVVTSLLVPDEGDNQSWDVFVIKSADGGATWGSPVNITGTPVIGSEYNDEFCAHAGSGATHDDVNIVYQMPVRETSDPYNGFQNKNRIYAGYVSDISNIPTVNDDSLQLQGEYESSMVIGNEVYVIDDVTFHDNLFIAPGTEIFVDNGFRLTVNGNLYASGTEDDTISIYPSNSSGSWDGLFVNGNIVVFDYGKIRGASIVGLGISETTTGHIKNSDFHSNRFGIRLNSVEPGFLISNNHVYDNASIGINVRYSSADIIGNHVHDNEDMGILLIGGSHATIKNNIIYNNGSTSPPTFDFYSGICIVSSSPDLVMSTPEYSIPIDYPVNNEIHDNSISGVYINYYGVPNIGVYSEYNGSISGGFNHFYGNNWSIYRNTFEQPDVPNDPPSPRDVEPIYAQVNYWYLDKSSTEDPGDIQGSGIIWDPVAAEVVDIAIDDEIPLLIMGLIHEQSGQFELAKQIYETFIETKPGLEATLTAVGGLNRCYEKQGQKEAFVDKLNDFSQVQDHDDLVKLARTHLIWSYKKIGATEEMVAIAEELAQEYVGTPDEAYYLFELALLIEETEGFFVGKISTKDVKIQQKAVSAKNALFEKYPESEVAELLRLLLGENGIYKVATLPEKFALHHAYPNPFNPVTTIRFDIPEMSNVKLVIYDLLGREVVRLIDDRRVAGKYNTIWDGKNNRGKSVASGLYI